MKSISSLAKRVISVTAVHLLSIAPTASLAPTTTRPALSSSVRLENIRHRQSQRRQPSSQPRALFYSGSSTALAAASTTTTSPEETSAHDDDDDDDDERTLVRNMLYRIRDCNRVPDDLRSVLLDFRLDGTVLGKVDPKVAEILCSTSVVSTTSDDGEDGLSRPVFELASAASASAGGSGTYLTLSEEASGTTSESRTRAVGAVMEELRRRGIVPGWRDELYPVSDSFYKPPVFLIERAATDLLGILGYGVHVNGILLPEQQRGEEENGGGGGGGDDEQPSLLPLMWMARRSETKSKYPSMLDHVVAGGQPAGLGLAENVIKECEEEAGIPPELARPGIDLRPAGVVSYEEAKKHDCGDGGGSFHMISRVVLFNYDLNLPGDFVPVPVDGEVEEFFLWSVDQIKESMAPDYPDPIKPNCYLVIIDYLLRMGYVSPETEGYLDVFRELRSGDCR